MKVATLVSTQLGAEDLLRMTAYAFGLESHAAHKSTLLQIVLVGQEALRTLVRGRALEHVHQRLVAA